MLEKIIAPFLVIGSIISNLLFPIIPSVSEPQILGADNFTPIQSQKFFLSGSGISASTASIGLRTFKTIDGREIIMSMLGDIAFGTLEPGSSREEQISFTGVTQSASDDTATLTGVSRGLDFITPYAASTTLQKAHAGGTIFVLSDNPGLFAEFAARDNDETILGQWTFPTSTTRAPKYTTTTVYTLTSSWPTSTLADIDYVNRVATSGAADASETIKGIIELATPAQVASGTSIGDDTTAALVIRAEDAGATSTSRTMIPVTSALGKLAQLFWDLTELFTFSGGLTSSATTTLSATTTISGKTTISGNTSSTGPFTFVELPTISANPTSTTQVVRKAYADSLTSIVTFAPDICQVDGTNAIRRLGTASSTWEFSDTASDGTVICVTAFPVGTTLVSSTEMTFQRNGTGNIRYGVRTRLVPITQAATSSMSTDESASVVTMNVGGNDAFVSTTSTDTTAYDGLSVAKAGDLLLFEFDRKGADASDTHTGGFIVYAFRILFK